MYDFSCFFFFLLYTIFMATKPTHVLVHVYIEEGILTIKSFDRNSKKSMMSLSDYLDFKSMLEPSSTVADVFDAVQEAARTSDEDHLNIILTIGEYKSAKITTNFDNIS